ncbi:hypothetical protein CASFOL_040353 [Castilleja foliolosa]|uniref:Pentatricopeptide repeat-containing protein n=1 Tax=Castilleja foliolosa TaxID=1961234 RepID=A0ABD3BFM6_9LAMI
MSLPASTSAPITIQHLSSPPPPSLEATTASWTSSIAYHCKNSRLSKAISQFTAMRTSGVDPNHITFVTLFSGCAHSRSHGPLIGPSVHAYARKIGLDVSNVMVGTAIIDMYSKFGETGLARLSFDRMVLKNKITWNTIINGYMRNGKFEDAVELFDEMPERDAVSWTVLIDGFVKKGKYDLALEWFQEMLHLGTAPDFVTIVSVLSAVANLGSLSLGLWVHRFVLMRGFIKDNIRVSNSLIDMYCKCGCVELAIQVFDKMPERSLVSWNSMIVGLAYNAHVEEALSYFHSLKRDGFNPDSVSFTGALNACSHAGLVEKGLELFENMKEISKINPRIEHYGCLVDLYSRAGRLKDALKVLDEMPMKPNEVVIGSLLAACRDCKDIDLAERLTKYIYDLDPIGDFNYVLLSNIYAATGSWRGASNVRKKMKALGVQKRPGISSIEVNGVIHEFVAGDKSHSDAESICLILEHLSDEFKICGHASDDIFSEACGFY